MSVCVSIRVHVCVCEPFSFGVCVLFCIPTLQGAQGEMGETCYCFTSHTSLTLHRGTHRTVDTTQDRVKEPEKSWIHRSISAPTNTNTKMNHSKCVLFGILLEIEDVGGGWWWSGGAQNYNPAQLNKSCLSLSICLSVCAALVQSLSCSCFQGWSESKIRWCLYRLKSCLYSDLITENMKDSQWHPFLKQDAELAIKTYKCSPL